MRGLIAFFMAASVLLMPMVAQAQWQPFYEVHIVRNIPYVTGEDAHERNVLDIYAPKELEDFPVLMFVSGGGWTTGSKSWISNAGMAFAMRGIGVVTVDHRLAPEVQNADQMHDIARAFAWIVENIADYGGDPNRIVVGGHSAGGQLIALLATDAQYVEATGHSISDIKGVIPVSGVLMVSSGDDDVFPADSYRDYSPVNHVSSDSALPPFLILLADRDEQNIILSAQLMQAALTEANANFNVLAIPGRDHFSIMQFVGQGDDLTTALITAWFGKIFEDNPS